MMQLLGHQMSLRHQGDLLVYLLALILVSFSLQEQQTTYPEGVHQLVVQRLQKLHDDSSKKFGSWGSWTKWSACSRSCGTGVSTQSRECLTEPHRKRKRIANLSRIKESKSRCVGRYKRFQLCNPQDCPGGYKDFRKEQCEFYNKTPFDKKFYKWEPYIDGANSCSLNCRAIGLSFYATLNQSVIDGTPCGVFHPQNRIHNRICVGGKCMQIGCDGVLGSGRVVDACGKCGGDNSTCKVISGVYSRSHLPFGYNVIATLPPKAENVSIYHVRPSSNYLALRELGGNYILNGPWGVNSSGSFGAAGTVFTYVRPQPFQGDYLYASGPLSHSVDVMLFAQRDNPGIKYEYRIPLQTLGPTRIAGNSYAIQNRYDLAAQRMPPTASVYPGTTMQSPSLQQDLSAFNRLSLMHRLHKSASSPTSRLEDPFFSLFSDDPDRSSTFNATNTYLSRLKGAQPSFPPAKRISNQINPVSFAPLNNNLNNALSDTRFHPSISQTNSYYSKTNRDFAQKFNNKILKSDLDYSKHVKRKPILMPNRHYNSVLYPTSTINPAPFSEHTEFHPFKNASYDNPHAALSISSAVPSNASPKVPKLSQFAPSYSWTGVPKSYSNNRGPFNDESIIKLDSSDTDSGGKGRNKKRHNKKKTPQGTHSSHKKNSRKKKYVWVPKGFTQCSQTCGGGTRSTRYVCMKKRNGVQKEVPVHFCSLPTPQQGEFPCNALPCPPAWYPEDWKPCSVTCGLGVQLRKLRCRKLLLKDRYVDLPVDECDQAESIPRAQVCQMSNCDGPPKWEVGQWSACSKLCGIGIRSRKVYCANVHGILPDSSCYYTKPSSEQMCDMGSCASDTWFFSPWDPKCSGPCGKGFRKRRIHCSGDAVGSSPNEPSSCPKKTRPSETQKCSTTQNCEGSWFTGPWSDCDGQCKAGLQRRAVLCIIWNRSKYKVTDDSECKASGPKPLDSKSCTVECKAEWFTSEWSECSVPCGDGGVQRREVKCLGGDLKPSLACHSATKPDSRQSCNTQSCDKSNSLYLVGSQPAYVSKSNTIRKNARTKTDSPAKNAINRKTESSSVEKHIGNNKERIMRPIRPGLPWNFDLCIDRMKNCNLVYKARLCKLKYYNELCCETCKANKI